MLPFTAIDAPPSSVAATVASPAQRAEASSPPTARLARFGAVTYLNSKPLIEDLATRLAPASLSLDYPSHLAGDLAAGRLDVALVPSFSALRGLVERRAWLLSDACVAAHGPVRSVKLLCRTDPGDIRTLALDEGSRTSATLAQVLLRLQYGTRPATQPFGLESRVEDCSADAILMIGDRAMHSPTGERFAHELDLGAEWVCWTGLPFVFAVWASRHEHVPAGWASDLEQARDRGVVRIGAIAEREAAGVGVAVDEAASYLRQNLHFTLGPAEREGLALFAELAAECGFLAQVPPLRQVHLAGA